MLGMLGMLLTDIRPVKDFILFQIDIPAGAILENKIVSGNLRILDH